MILLTWCDFLCMRCSGVCDVAHEVLYPFCVIVMCDSNINTFQIASTPITLCEQLHKIACKRIVCHAEKSHRVNGPLVRTSLYLVDVLSIQWIMISMIKALTRSVREGQVIRGR